MAANAQGKYWQYEALVFANMQTLDRPHFEQWAQQIGLNMDRFRRDLDSHAQQALIEADKTLAQALGATGTPMFFINGRKLRGAQPLDGFKRIIDAEIERAQAAIRDQHVTAAQVYEHLTKNGATRMQLIQGPGAAPGQPGGPPGAAAGPRPGEPDPNRVYAIAAPTYNAPSKGGPRNAPVTIYVFSDFQ